MRLRQQQQFVLQPDLQFMLQSMSRGTGRGMNSWGLAAQCVVHLPADLYACAPAANIADGMIAGGYCLATDVRCLLPDHVCTGSNSSGGSGSRQPQLLARSAGQRQGNPFVDVTRQSQALQGNQSSSQNLDSIGVYQAVVYIA
jgi:hypothetical protein